MGSTGTAGQGGRQGGNLNSQAKHFPKGNSLSLLN